MIASDVIDRVRAELNDTAAGQYRWDDDTLLGYLSDAQRQLKDLRPDVFLSGASMLTPGELTATSDALSVDEKYRTALVYLVSGLVLEEDQSDANVEKATYYEARAMKVLGLTGK